MNFDELDEVLMVIDVRFAYGCLYLVESYGSYDYLVSRMELAVRLQFAYDSLAII